MNSNQINCLITNLPNFQSHVMLKNHSIHTPGYFKGKKCVAEVINYYVIVVLKFEIESKMTRFVNIISLMTKTIKTLTARLLFTLKIIRYFCGRRSHSSAVIITVNRISNY